MVEPELAMLPDGTTLRWRYLERGEYADVEIFATVENGRIQFQDEPRSPFGATRDFDQLIRGDGASGGVDHPYEAWEWHSGDGWEPILSLLDIHK